MMSPLCLIVPPYILEALSKHADEATMARARQTLILTERLTAQRMFLANAPQTISSHQSERRTICDLHHDDFLPGRVARREGDPPVVDPAINQAYDNAGTTYDFFEKVFNRRSIDGKNMRLLSSVHYSKHYDNAFWNGEQMVYGDGDGVVFGSFTNALDVIAHELTHGVTQMTCNLTYHGESGALNESISDVFGSMVKQWHLKQTVDEADWLIGDGLIADKKFGRALRSLKAPGTAYDNMWMGGKDPQPAHYRDYDRSRSDEGGVHVNSGIPNHAFYLAARELSGHSWQTAGSIWYDALTSDGIFPTCTFAQFASRTVEVASKQTHPAAAKAIRHAWHLVGVTA
jgi:Zn-dependent metalloprotease